MAGKAILLVGALLGAGCGSVATPRQSLAMTSVGDDSSATAAAQQGVAEEIGPPAPAFMAAVERAPEVRAAAAALRAAELRARAAGILPDPVLSAEGWRMRAERTQGVELWLKQDFPRWGERDAQRGMAAAEAAMAQVELDDARGMAAAEIAAALVRASAAEARARLQDEEAARMRTLVEQVSVAVAAGGDARAGDALALRTRIDAAELMARDLRRMAADARDEAHARSGLPADQALPEPLMPPLGAAVVAAYAPLRMAQARAAAAAADGAMARSQRYPMVGVGLGWEREDLDLPEDGVLAMVELRIPLYQGAYADREHAARAQGDAARRKADAEQLRAQTLLRRAQRARQQAEAATRNAESVSRRVDAELEALRGQLAAGAGAMGGRDVLMRVFERLDARATARLAAIDAQAEADAMTAELWRLVPFTSPQGPP